MPFATPPFYANSDDQTIFNDVTSCVDIHVVMQPCRTLREGTRTGLSYVPCVPLRRRAACSGGHRCKCAVRIPAGEPYVPCKVAPQVIISATLGIRSFLGSTARMEARSKHNNLHGPGWATLPEAKRHGQQIQEVNRQRRVWKGLKLPWVNIGVSGGLGPKSNPVPIIPIGFGETIALAPLKLFGHLATGGAASMVKPPLGGAQVRLLRLLRACLAARGGARVAQHSWERGLATALPALP